MATLPLDLEGVLASAPRAKPRQRRWPTGTHDRARPPPGRLDPGGGRVLRRAALGFEPIVRGYPGALFVSAGGYHHHVGLNTWAGEGVPAPPAGRARAALVHDRAPGRRRRLQRRRGPLRSAAEGGGHAR